MDTIRTYLRDPRWIAPVMGILTFIYGYGFITIELDAFHVGLMAKGPIDILNGKNLFSETYFYQGTGFPNFIALVFSIFGKSAYVLNLAGLTAYSFVAVFLVLNWSRLIDAKGLWLSAIFWLAHLPLNAWKFIAWPSIYALLSQLVALYFCLLFLEKKRPSLLIITGLMIASAWSFRWTVGLMSLIGFSGYFVALHILSAPVRLKISGWLCFASGVLLGLAPSVLYLILTNSVTDWYQQTILGKAIWAEYYGSPILNNPFLLFGYMPEIQLSPFGIFMEHWVWKLLPSLAILFFGWLAVQAWRSRGENNPKLPNEFFIALAFSVLILVSWHQYFPVPCTRHMFWAISLGFFLPYYLARALLTNNYYKKIKIGLVAAMALLLIYESGERYLYGAKRMQMQSHLVKVQKPKFLAGIKLTLKEFQYFARVSYISDAVFRVNPDHKVIAYVKDPSNFLANEKIETFHQVFYDAHDLAFRTYPDFLPRLRERLLNDPGYWLVDQPNYIARMRSMLPELKLLASVQEKLYIVYNPKLVTNEEVEKFSEILRAIPKYISKDHQQTTNSSEKAP